MRWDAWSVNLLETQRHSHHFAFWSGPQGNTATFLKNRGCEFVLWEAPHISDAPSPVSCRARGGPGLSLDGFGDVLNSRISKQACQTMLPSAAVQRRIRRFSYFLPWWIGGLCLPGRPSRPGPWSFWEFQWQPHFGCSWLVCVFNLDMLLCHRRCCFGKTCYQSRQRQA